MSAARDEDEAYDALRDACDRGAGCPRCLTMIAWQIRKVADPRRRPFDCLGCGFTFYGWADAFGTTSAPSTPPSGAVA